MSADERGWGPPCPDSEIVSISAGGRTFRVHKRVRVIFEEFVTELVTRGYPIDRGTLDDWSYVCRRINNDPSRPWSNHAWGLAIDLNSLTNPQKNPLTTDMPAWVRDAKDLMTRYGLRWGGTFQTTADPMHYEFMLTPADADRLSLQLLTPAPPEEEVEMVKIVITTREWYAAYPSGLVRTIGQDESGIIRKVYAGNVEEVRLTDAEAVQWREFLSRPEF